MKIKHCAIYFLLLFFTAPLAASSTVPYSVQMQGLSSSVLRGLIESNSLTVTTQSKPPVSISGLRLRIEDDMPQLLEILHAYGYYSARISYSIMQNLHPVVVLFNFDLGPQYTFNSFCLSAFKKEEMDGAPPLLLKKLITEEQIDVKKGKPAMASAILDTEQKILDELAHHGYPFAKIINRSVVVDQASKKVDVSLQIDPGMLIYFGDIDFLGLCNVDPCWLQSKMEMKTGCLYDPDCINASRRALENTGLFTTIEIVASDVPDDRGYLPIHIALVESKHRSVMFGVTYTTDQSVGCIAGWENRNLRGRGENISLKGSINTIKQEINAGFRKPDFRRINQDLLIQLQHKAEFLKSYDDRSDSFSVSIERKYNANLLYSYGLKAEELHTFQDGEKQHFFLISAPLRLRWTRVNNPYLPNIGMALDLKATPYSDITENGNIFSVQKGSYTCFYPIVSDRLILMGKVILGSIATTNTERVPPSIRFYEGSYNGLRGYTYQTVSPVDRQGQPTGGLSLAVYSIETRLRLSQRFFFTPFFDAGNVYASCKLDFKGQLYRAWGAGVSYLTIIGPMRLDVALPLDRRPNLDPSYQIYFSVGATF